MNPLTEAMTSTLTSTIGRVLLNELLTAPWETTLLKNIDGAGVALGTYIGSKRSRNEDRIAIANITTKGGDQFSVAVVCDGVGGSEKGDAAATLAIAVFIDALAQSDTIKQPSEKISLRNLLIELMRNVDNCVRDALKGKGTTTMSVLLGTSSGQFVATNVGDSRIFKWSPTIPSLIQVSVDDTIDNEFKKMALKDISILDARGLRGTLSQAIGEVGRSSQDLNLTIEMMDNFKGEGAILATDGAWKGDEFGFNSLALHATSALESMRRILSLSSWTGGLDNVSIIAIDDLTSFAKGCDDPIRKLSNLTWATVWICDTKFVICDGSRPTNYQRRKANNSSDSPQKTAPEEKIRRRGAKKYAASSLDKNSRQLEFLDERSPTNFERKDDVRQKIEISTDDESEKLKR